MLGHYITIYIFLLKFTRQDIITFYVLLKYFISHIVYFALS